MRERYRKKGKEVILQKRNRKNCAKASGEFNRRRPNRGRDEETTSVNHQLRGRLRSKFKGGDLSWDWSEKVETLESAGL